MSGTTRLKDLALQLGYDYRVDLSLDDLGAFDNAPWRVRVADGKAAGVLEVLHRQSPLGLFLLGDFSVDYSADNDCLTQTVAAVRLNAEPAGLKRFVSNLRLQDGLRCVMRGDSLYVFVDTFTFKRSSRLSTAEATACLKALELMAQGKYAGAFAQLASIRGSLVWGTGRIIPWVILSAVWGTWIYALATIPAATPGILVGGGLLVVLHIVVWVTEKAKRADLKAYAARRIG